MQKCKSSPNCSHNTNGRALDKPCSIELKQILRVLPEKKDIQWHPNPRQTNTHNVGYNEALDDVLSALQKLSGNDG